MCATFVRNIFRCGRYLKNRRRKTMQCEVGADHVIADHLINLLLQGFEAWTIQIEVFVSWPVCFFPSCPCYMLNQETSTHWTLHESQTQDDWLTGEKYLFRINAFTKSPCFHEFHVSQLPLNCGVTKIISLLDTYSVLQFVDNFLFTTFLGIRHVHESCN
jgi:hypothetical protein